MRSKDSLVYELVRKIPEGKVSTYKNISRAVGIHPRTVGMILRDNKKPSVRCYKIVKSDGTLGGYNAGPKKKILLLKKEGIEVVNGRIDLKKYLHNF